mmetsp:Transcript_13273/g.26135  ORF Transcript_13273/g.26135 Transcript_13273/m.26135 type:complete len:207 (+) Transcript_13273:855-1475(+)
MGFYLPVFVWVPAHASAAGARRRLRPGPHRRANRELFPRRVGVLPGAQRSLPEHIRWHVLAAARVRFCELPVQHAGALPHQTRRCELELDQLLDALAPRHPLQRPSLPGFFSRRPSNEYLARAGRGAWGICRVRKPLCAFYLAAVVVVVVLVRGERRSKRDVGSRSSSSHCCNDSQRRQRRPPSSLSRSKGREATVPAVKARRRVG